MASSNWQNIAQITSKSYRCGYCGNSLVSNTGFIRTGPNEFIYICHHCGRPTYFEGGGRQTPGIAFGNTVTDIPEAAVRELYEEARRATSASLLYGHGAVLPETAHAYCSCKRGR